MKKVDKKVGACIEITPLGSQVPCYCFYIFQTSPVRSIHGDCSNHSPCFIHMVSEIKRYIAKNANEPTSTSLTVWIDLSYHLTPKSGKKNFFFPPKYWPGSRDLAH